MKSIYIIFISLLCFNFSQAQIEEGLRSMSQGSNNSLSVDIPNASEKLAKKVWSKYLKSTTKKGKTKTDKKAKLIFTDNAEHSAIGGANTVDIYLRLTEVGENVNATVWFDLGGAYLSSEMHGDKYTEGEKFLMRFALEVVIEQTKIELKAEEKKGKELAKQLSSLKKKKDGYHKDIEDAEKKIRDAESNIEKNIEEQTAKNKAIKEQDGTIEAVKKRLKDLED